MIRAGDVFDGWPTASTRIPNPKPVLTVTATDSPSELPNINRVGFTEQTFIGTITAVQRISGYLPGQNVPSTNYKIMPIRGSDLLQLVNRDASLPVILLRRKDVSPSVAPIASRHRSRRRRNHRRNRSRKN
jgi:hypothetical protein